MSDRFSKAEALLILYTKIIEENEINKDELQTYLGLNNITFYRYIAEIRKFLSHHKPEVELHYRRSNNTYILKKKEK